MQDIILKSVFFTFRGSSSVFSNHCQFVQHFAFHVLLSYFLRLM